MNPRTRPSWDRKAYERFRNGNAVCPDCGTETRLEIVYEGRTAAGGPHEGKTLFTLFCPICPKRFDRCTSVYHMRSCGLPVGHAGLHQQDKWFWATEEATG